MKTEFTQAYPETSDRHGKMAYLKQYAKAKGKDPRNLEIFIHYLSEEMKAMYKYGICKYNEEQYLAFMKAKEMAIEMFEADPEETTPYLDKRIGEKIKLIIKEIEDLASQPNIKMFSSDVAIRQSLPLGLINEAAKELALYSKMNEIVRRYTWDMDK